MSRQILNIGTVANDKTGDKMRAAAQKINENFALVWDLLGDSDVLSAGISITDLGIEFDGATADAFKTTLLVIDPTQNNIISLPDGSGTLITEDATSTLTNKTLTTPILTTPVINDLSLNHTFTLVAEELTENVILTLPTFTDSDSFVLKDVVQTLNNKTLVSPILTTPSIDSPINDVNTNPILGFVPIASAVNYITFKNNIAAQDPEMSVDGSDSDVNLVLSGKGEGSVTLKRYALESELVTGAGAVGFNAPLTRFSNAGALAITMADGSVQGQLKELINEGAGIVTVTVTNLSGGTEIILNPDDRKSVLWSGNKWYLPS